jgi:hypothetical protein
MYKGSKFYKINTGMVSPIILSVSGSARKNRAKPVLEAFRADTPKKIETLSDQIRKKGELEELNNSSLAKNEY